jgi:hypothetical protein
MKHLGDTCARFSGKDENIGRFIFTYPTCPHLYALSTFCAINVAYLHFEMVVVLVAQKMNDLIQGDQIGRIFASRVVVNFGQYF